MPAWWEHLLHVVTGRSSRHGDLPDLRQLASRRVALERTHYLVNDHERRSQESRVYVLRRAPDRHRDPLGIAVYSNGRDVGHLPASVSASLWPLLRRIGGRAVVAGSGPQRGSIRLRVDVPTTEALRVFADSLGDREP